MLELRFPKASDEATLRLAYEELNAEGHTGFLLDGFQEDPADYTGWLQRVQNHHIGIGLTDDRVPSSFYLALVGNEIVGRISIRHELNDFLRNFGGHIGYMVRPGFRQKGYATQMLMLALSKARELSLDRVLLTCDDDNIGSRKVIESQGGVLENIVLQDGKPLRRYWIELS